MRLIPTSGIGRVGLGAVAAALALTGVQVARTASHDAPAAGKAVVLTLEDNFAKVCAKAGTGATCKAGNDAITLTEHTNRAYPADILCQEKDKLFLYQGQRVGSDAEYDAAQFCLEKGTNDPSKVLNTTIGLAYDTKGSASAYANHTGVQATYDAQTGKTDFTKLKIEANGEPGRFETSNPQTIIVRTEPLQADSVVNVNADSSNSTVFTFEKGADGRIQPVREDSMTFAPKEAGILTGSLRFDTKTMQPVNSPFDPAYKVTKAKDGSVTLSAKTVPSNDPKFQNRSTTDAFVAPGTNNLVTSARGSAYAGSVRSTTDYPAEGTFEAYSVSRDTPQNVGAAKLKQGYSVWGTESSIGPSTVINR